MSDIDERELGHWRRLATAAAGDGELELEPELREAVAHGRRQHAGPGQARPVPTAAPPAMAAEDAEMRVRLRSYFHYSRNVRQVRTDAQLLERMSPLAAGAPDGHQMDAAAAAGHRAQLQSAGAAQL